jgi:hypothetical protein
MSIGSRTRRTKVPISADGSIIIGRPGLAEALECLAGDIMRGMGFECIG